MNLKLHDTLSFILTANVVVVIILTANIVSVVTI